MSAHVTDILSQHLDGALPSARSAAIAAHLLECMACRAAHDEIVRGRAALGSLGRHRAPEGSWEAVERALDSARAELPRRRRSGALLALAAVLAVAALLGVILGRDDSWRVTPIEGPAAAGRLEEGQWLETGDGSRVRLEIGRLGHVDVEPDSRLRLLSAPGPLRWGAEASHRVELERGTLHAVILAPPRLFVVDTPAASAVDLGCAYSLVVSPSGAGRLRVTSGRVQLERDGRESIVLAGAACEMRPGLGPGTPYFVDAPRELREALGRVDVGGGAADLDVVLAAARPRDALTLWHLVPRTALPERERIALRLVEMAPLPGGVTLEGVLALDETMLRRWRRSLEPA